MTEQLIRPLQPDDAPACDAVIASLPYFFGDPDGRAMCAEAVRTQPGVAAEIDGALAGFITLDQHNADTMEITWMAVHAQRRRGGIGRALINAACERASVLGARMLQPRLRARAALPSLDPLGLRAFQLRLGAGQGGLGGGERSAEPGAFTRAAGEVGPELRVLKLERRRRILKGR